MRSNFFLVSSIWKKNLKNKFNIIEMFVTGNEWLQGTMEYVYILEKDWCNLHQRVL